MSDTALTRSALLLLALAVAFVAAPAGDAGRPASPRGLSLVVDTYCPEKRPDVEEFFEDWNFDDVVRD